MNQLCFMLADMDTGELLNAQSHSMDSRVFQMLIVLGSILLAVIIGGIVAIVVSLRKKKRKRHRHHHQPEPPAAKIAEPPPPQHESRRRVRRSGHPHRPMNPTLAETRGLPPVRDENTPLPPMP